MDKRNMQELKDQLLAIVINGGASEAGVADLSLASEAMENHADPRLKRFTQAVSFIIPFPRSVIEELLEGPSNTYIHYYRVVNTLIDDLSLRVTTALEAHGYEAFPVPSSQRAGKNKLDSIFPHRVAGFLAGMGWIGKSGCLVNKTSGPRVRLGTVLTNAPLPPDGPQTVQCGECKLCTEACPAGAIKGILFAQDIPLGQRLVPELCNTYQNEVRDRFGRRVCGLCLASCPFGKPHS